MNLLESMKNAQLKLGAYFFNGKLRTQKARYNFFQNEILNNLDTIEGKEIISDIDLEFYLANQFDVYLDQDDLTFRSPSKKYRGYGAQIKYNHLMFEKTLGYKFKPTYSDLAKIINDIIIFVKHNNDRTKMIRHISFDDYFNVLSEKQTRDYALDLAI